MPVSLIPSFLAYCYIGAITPGPANLSAYVLPYTDSFWHLLAVGLFLPLTGPVANLVWLFAGATLQKLFSQYQKTVDVVLAVSLMLCAVTLVMPH